MNDTEKPDSITSWHRIFGLTLEDFFTDTAYEVELEKDLSKKQQYLDVAVIKKHLDEELEVVPDGLDNLQDHNLISFKSHQETLNDWTIKELIGHYCNYRKQISPAMDELLDEDQFILYAVSVRFPRKLFSQLSYKRIQKGVYEIIYGTQLIRIIVLNRIPSKPENSIWLMFSAIAEMVKYGVDHYLWKNSDLSTILNQLFKKYNLEGINMPYTIEDYKRDYKKEFLNSLSEKERDEMLKMIPNEEKLKDVPIEEKLKNVSNEEKLKDVPIEEKLKDVPIEEIKKYLQSLNEDKE